MHNLLAIVGAVLTVVGIIAGGLELRAAHKAYDTAVAKMGRPPDVPGHPLNSYATLEHIGPLLETLYRGNVALRLVGVASLISGVVLTLVADLSG